MSRDTRKCIKDFVRHVETLEAEDDTEGNGFNREYRHIHEVQVKNRRENIFQMTAGRADNNLKKNRYKDILPYDEHRVLLSPKEGEENSDYINASRLMGVKGTGGYIASQGPLASTVDDYWRMIWECDVEIIFMACKIVELGKIKCKQYWNDVDKSDPFGDITVFTESEEEISSDFIRRKFRVTRGEEKRQVIQFQYLGWPDHGIPDDPAHIRDLISIVRQTRQNEEAPLLVHCSAGCGRTGAIVAIDFVWTLLEHGRFDETFSLYELICNLREQRMSMVQTADQYALVNKVLKTLCKEWLDKMASHTYVNVELKQAAETDTNEEYQNTVFVESSKRPDAGTKLAHERHSGQGASTDPGQDIEDVSPPSFAAPNPPTGAGNSASSYENVVLLPDRTPMLKTAQDNKPNEPNQATLHMTVIQLGSGTATTASSASAASSGGPQMVVNHVRGGSTRSTASTSSSSTASALGVTPPTSPTTAAAVVIPESQQNQQDLSAVYASVHKGGRIISPEPKPSKPQTSNPSTDHAGSSTQTSGGSSRPKILTDNGGYSFVQFPEAGVDAGAGKASHLGLPPPSGSGSVGVYDLAEPLSNGSSSTPRVLIPIQTAAEEAGKRVKTGQVSNGPQATEFGQRLPRVNGPVPTPESWNTNK